MPDSTSTRVHRLRTRTTLLAILTLLSQAGCEDPQAPSAVELASFAITLPDSGAAGEPVTLSVEAIGTDGTRPLVDFEGTVSLSVSSGTVTPDQLTLLNGAGTAEVVIGPVAGNVIIEVSARGRSATAPIRLSAPRRLLGAATDAAVEAIPNLSFRPEATSYVDGHPDLPGIPVSVSIALVTLDPAATVGEVNLLLAAHDAEIVAGIPGRAGATSGLLYLRLPTTSHAEMDGTLESLEADPTVEVATADYGLVTAALPLSATPAEHWTWDGELEADGNWGLELSRVPQMWNLNLVLDALDGPAVPVGVVDGELGDHTDLAPVTQHGPPLAAGHGTHVAGIIGATYGNGVGIDGVTPYADLYLAGDSTATAGTVFDGLRDLAGDGVRVVNVSINLDWRGSPPSIPPSELAPLRRSAIQFERLHATISSGGSPVLIIASAGNDTIQTADAAFGSAWGYAALERGFEHVIVVEAIELDAAGDPAARRADFSFEHGHVSAPGVRILSTDRGDGYRYRSGTSMAAPFVTGLVSYMLSVDPTLTNVQIRDILQTTAVAVRPSSDGTGASNRVDAFSAVLDIDRVRGDSRVLHLLLDIDDGTPDGNLRVEPGDPGVPFYDDDADLNGRPGDGDIDMSDFRRWRDLWLATADLAGTTFDGPEDHPKRDLNGNGIVVDDPDDPLYPLADFNGDGRLSPFDAVDMAGALGFLGPLTDLEVLQALFDDPDYDADELPELLESGDVVVQLSRWVLDWEGEGNVGSTIETVFEDGSVIEKASRYHDIDQSATTYTLPAFEQPWRASAWVVAPEGDTICIVTHDVIVARGSDEYWTPTCGRTLEVEVGLDASIEPGVPTPVVVRAGISHEGGPVRYQAGLDVALRVTGGSAAVFTGTTNEDGFFGTTATMDSDATSMTVTADVSEPESGLFGSGQATASALVTSGRVTVQDLTAQLVVGAYAGDGPTTCSDETVIDFTMGGQDWDLSHSCAAEAQGQGHSASVTSTGSIGFDFSEDSTSLTGLDIAITHHSIDSATGLASSGAYLTFQMTFRVGGGSAAHDVSGSASVDAGSVDFRLTDGSRNVVWRGEQADAGRSETVADSIVLDPGDYTLTVIYWADRGIGNMTLALTWR